ncbi:flavin-containing monooxygenase FMO GS-OX-like 2 isoform X6 [Oryza glaberrima]|uniref:flavin-containing monooxygenase FMO GS-OX-like 2 isoform X6 n=1 Tax=Oryza glaberrima TaxID=4538 RepID=UPI00224C343B|nr:flavin-containing monooxygenase FMO GS-OX-like 2 isoform X6 [Oryza glaberrima]
MPRTVAVVGAGAAGLVAARELLREGHAVTVFERSARVGGTWAYDPRSDPDPPCLDTAAAGAAAVHGSLYASLRTNLPRELMGFSGFALAGRVFAGDPRTFPGHREVLAFLDAFAVESGVAGRVRLRAEVVRVGPLAGHGERWTVAWRGEGGVEEEEEVFDAVVVCNGHCTVPLVPKLRGIGNWQGKQMHSHNYRTPEPFQDQIVVVVGLGASGVDIAREISNVAKEVHIASRWIASKMMAKCVSAKDLHQSQQIPFFTAQGIGTISRSWTWRGSPSTATASGLCTSTSSPRSTRRTSPSSACQSRQEMYMYCADHHVPVVRAGVEVGRPGAVGAGRASGRGGHGGRRGGGLPADGRRREAQAAHARPHA